MDFDHVRGIKKANISTMVRQAYSIETIKEEVAKCDLVCANCHRKRTAKRQGWNKYMWNRPVLIVPVRRHIGYCRRLLTARLSPPYIFLLTERQRHRILLCTFRTNRKLVSETTMIVECCDCDWEVGFALDEVYFCPRCDRWLMRDILSPGGVFYECNEFLY